jgi:hypothetical protein
MAPLPRRPLLAPACCLLAACGGDDTSARVATVAWLLDEEPPTTPTVCVQARDVEAPLVGSDSTACAPTSADIADLVEALRARGHAVSGPSACDTVASAGSSSCDAQIVDAATGEGATLVTAGCPEEEDGGVALRIIAWRCDLAATGWLCHLRPTLGGWLVDRCDLEWIS